MAYQQIPTRTSSDTAIPYQDTNQIQDNFDIIFDSNGKIFNLPFPATQVPSADANTLDDYEEGTWTPGVTFGGLSTNVTYYTQYNKGFYTKVGNLVSITGQLSLTSNGSATGVAKITGLPFTNYNNEAAICAPGIYSSGVTFANQLGAYLSQNDNAIALRETTEAGVPTALTEGDLSDSTSIVINLTYRTA